MEGGGSPIRSTVGKALVEDVEVEDDSVELDVVCVDVMVTSPFELGWSGFISGPGGVGGGVMPGGSGTPPSGIDA